MILDLIILVIPGMISTLIYRILQKKKFQLYSYIEYWAIFSFCAYCLINFFMYFRGYTDYVFKYLDSGEQILYIAVYLLLSIFLPVTANFSPRIHSMLRSCLNKVLKK